MLNSTHSNRQPLAIVMLIMVLWQCLFVAVEAGAHSPNTADFHHQISTQPHSDSPSPCENPTCSDDKASDTHQPDSCDHCCACQGHCAHISIYVKFAALELAAPSFVPAGKRQEFRSLYPPSIYRPPIS